MGTLRRYRASVLRMRAAPAFSRTVCAALLALLLALRTLGAAGYMPSFEHGAVTIIVCPDAEVNAPLALATHHHHGNAAHEHQLCPYASASVLGALGAKFTALLDVLMFGAALLLLGRTFRFIERNSARERPRTRAPPLPA
jgi:hypothetical protein